MAQMNPPSSPPSISGATAAISRVCRNWCQVQPAVAIAQTSRMPVLFTVPLSVIRLAASIAPPYWLSERPLKVLLPSAGLEVLNNAIAFSPCRLFRLSQRQGITAGPPAGSGPKATSKQRPQFPAPNTGRGVQKAEPYALAAFLNRMQRIAKVPLLVGGDFERGASMRSEEHTSN